MADEKKKEVTKPVEKKPQMKDPEVTHRQASDLYSTLASLLLQDLHRSSRAQAAKQIHLVHSDKEQSKFILSNENLALQKKIRPQIGELEAEIGKLRSEINHLLEQKLDVRQKEKQIRELEEKFKALTQKESLSHLLNRVGSAAQEKLLSSSHFRALFERESPCAAYVLSIDIRRSTELMLKARQPKLYAEFIMTLVSRLRNSILELWHLRQIHGRWNISFLPRILQRNRRGIFCDKSGQRMPRGFCYALRG